jgi:predicted amino acid dehydrogenase
MLQLPEKIVYRKIIQTGQMAERLGAKILGLGAFTSVVGDGGITIARELDIPVTSGDSYTVATAVQALQKAASLLDLPIGNSNAAVVGATGAIGRVCAEMLAGEVNRLYLIGRRPTALEELRGSLQGQNPPAELITSTTVEDFRNAQLILSVTSSVHALIQPEYLQPGSVICDVARPRDVAAKLAIARPDVLVIDGGMVEVPGKVNFHFDFGFPPGKAYACMAETMALALEGRFEDYTLGKQITRQRVEEITHMAEKHGFHLSGFRSFGRAVSEDTIERVRQYVRPSLKDSIYSRPAAGFGG